MPNLSIRIKVGVPYMRLGVRGQRNVLTRFVRIDTKREVDAILVEKRLQRMRLHGVVMFEDSV